MNKKIAFNTLKDNCDFNFYHYNKKKIIIKIKKSAINDYSKLEWLKIQESVVYCGVPKRMKVTLENESGEAQSVY